MTLPLDEFLRPFLLHLLPKGFVRIRHFGFLANRRRAAFLPPCFTALGVVPRRSNQKPPPPSNRNLFGGASSVAHRWRSSNDLPLLKSNSVLHHCLVAAAAGSPTTRTTLAVHRAPPPFALLLTRSVLPDLLHTVFDCRFSLPNAPRPPPPSKPTPANFNPSASLHLICIRPPRPPRQRLPSDGFFERTPHSSVSLHSAHHGRASEKALADSGTMAKVSGRTTSPDCRL
jgi:hypothetical protein